MELTDFCTRTKEFKQVLTAIQKHQRQLITGISGSARTLLLTALQKSLNQPQLVITDSLFHMQELAADLENLLPEEEIYQFPVEEVLAAEVATSSPNYRLQRVQALNALINNKPAIVIASTAGLRRNIVAPELFKQAELSLKVGGEIDPEKAADMLKGVSTWSLNSANEFRNVQKKIQALVDSGQLGIFANGYFGHAAMKLPPEVNLIAVAHYLQALECQRDANRVVALLGSKTPHIQNLAIGGVANPINLDSQAVLNQERLMFVKACIDRLTDFINQVYKVDAAVFAAYYPEWLSLGKTSGNYLSVPEYPIDADNAKFMLKGGYIENGDLSTFRAIDQQKDEFVVKGIKESGKHAWYEDDEPLEPWAGLTRPKYTGWQDDGKYSWVKAPTFYGKVVEVGPLAYLMCGLAANDTPTVNHFNELKGIYEKLTGNTLTTDQLHSTLGRIIGRTVHCCAINDILSAQWQMLIDNIAKGDMTAYIKTDIPANGEFLGVGFGEVPRGMLSHWVVIKDGRIENYQAVVPSTWNAGPRNEQDQMGPYELSIIGTPVADPTKPLEVVRTIHSFDPCMSCAVHVVNTENGEVTEVKVL